MGGVSGLRGRRAVIVGQGYVGLPLAMRAVRAGYDVVGYDSGKNCTTAQYTEAIIKNLGKTSTRYKVREYKPIKLPSVPADRDFVKAKSRKVVGVDLSERGNCFLSETIGEVFAIIAKAEIFERQHRHCNSRRNGGGGSDRLDRCNKAIATFRHRLDKPGVVGSLVQSFAQLRDVVCERHFLHEAVRPQPSEEFVLFQQTSLALNQQKKSVKDFGLQRYGFPVAN